jgi:hypothetical protein
MAIKPAATPGTRRGDGGGRLLTVARMALRITFAVQLLLGIGLWTGRLDNLTAIHIAVGVLFVLSLWTVAVIAARAGVNRIQVGVALLWGALMAVFGLAQQDLLNGNLHWIIQILHLAVSIAGIAQAEALAAAVARGALVTRS